MKPAEGKPFQSNVEVSFMTKALIRYEGTMVNIDREEGTITL